MGIDKSLTVHFTPEVNPDLRRPDPHQDNFSKVYMGFWMYLMTDCILFATLFITYAVFMHSTFGGPSGKDLFSLKTAFSETMALLLSSLTSGLAMLAACKNNIRGIYGWLIATALLGTIFLGLELNEFFEFVHEGHSWRQSAFLSSFFTLVGTHGLHITTGLFWLSVMLVQLSFFGLTVDTFRRLFVFNLFWHFLDLIWIFIFTFVYLMGVI
jgi:cytochrome o ubiquinol oxidase subunit 3